MSWQCTKLQAPHIESEFQPILSLKSISILALITAIQYLALPRIESFQLWSSIRDLLAPTINHSTIQPLFWGDSIWRVFLCKYKILSNKAFNSTNTHCLQSCSYRRSIHGRPSASSPQCTTREDPVTFIFFTTSSNSSPQWFNYALSSLTNISYLHIIDWGRLC